MYQDKDQSLVYTFTLEEAEYFLDVKQTFTELGCCLKIQSPDFRGFGHEIWTPGFSLSKFNMRGLGLKFTLFVFAREGNIKSCFIVSLLAILVCCDEAVPFNRAWER